MNEYRDGHGGAIPEFPAGVRWVVIQPILHPSAHKGTPAHVRYHLFTSEKEAKSAAYRAGRLLKDPCTLQVKSVQQLIHESGQTTDSSDHLRDHYGPYDDPSWRDD